jgi:hypothetical protein
MQVISNSLITLIMGKIINNDTWFTPGEMLQWYYICALKDTLFYIHFKRALHIYYHQCISSVMLGDDNLAIEDWI